MSRQDFGRFRNRGANNGRIAIGNTEPEDPVINDIWVNPEIVFQYLQKSSNQDIASTTTMQNITGLVTTLGAGGTYKVEASLFVTGNAATDISIDWDYVCATTPSHRECHGMSTASTSAVNCSMRDSSHYLATDVDYGLSGSTGMIINESFIITTTNATGSVQIRAAQVASSATAITILAASYMTITPLVSNIKYYTGNVWASLL